jgi:4-hydroxybenzoate polyprenyltransferase
MAALLAWRTVPFRPLHLLGIVLAMATARAAAMAFNRLADRHDDALNPRTAGRHLPAGILGVRQVALFCGLSAAAFIASTLLFLPNLAPLALSVPVLAFLCGYSYAKRFTVLCHYWLAAALMASPIAVWIALTGAVGREALWLAGAVFFWVGGFDIIYACQDTDFDRRLGRYSLPAWLGNRGALTVAALSHLLCAGCLLGLWHAAGLGNVFLAGVAAVAVLLAVQHSLVRPHDLKLVNVAFFWVNAVISLGLLAVTAVDLLVQAA